MTENKARTEIKKARNVQENEARKSANAAAVSAKGIEPRTSTRERVIRGRDGRPVLVKEGKATRVATRVTTSGVRNSKLLRAARRKDLAAAWLKAAAASPLKPAEDYSTAEHLAAAEKRAKLVRLGVE